MSTVVVRQALALAPLVSNVYKRFVAKALDRWNRNNGFKWASDRCKSIIEYLLKLRAGETVARPSWVSHQYLRYAEDIAREGTFSKFSQLIQVWRIYTAIGPEYTNPTVEQVEKFEAALTSAAPGAVEGLSPYTLSHPRASIKWSTVTRRRSVREALPEVRLPDHVPVRNPLSLRMRDPDGSLSREWDELIADSHTLVLWANKFGLTRSWPFALRQIPPLYVDRGWPRKTGAAFGAVGEIKCRVQKDGKARFFLSPSQWVQYLMGPWAKELYKQLSHIPQDCTFDQGKGAERVRQWLKEGREVYSFDLSSATDRFPLALTRTILMSLVDTPNMRMWVDTFCILSRIPARKGYADHRGNVNSTIGWKVGQPLGAIPSFAAFALSHHALVRGLYDGDPTEAPYVILGDDLVIADKVLAEAYRETITRLGVTISEAKSLQGRLGEFAGRIISGEGWEFKLKYFHLSYRTLLSMVTLIGPRALKGMPRTRLRDIIALIPTPRTPGGVNPGGFKRELVDKFLTLYYTSLRDVEVPRELWVDSETAVQARTEVLLTAYRIPEWVDTTRAREPRGSAKEGLGGAPQGGPVKGLSKWSWSPYLSRSWLQRVRRLAKEAGLL